MWLVPCEAATSEIAALKMTLWIGTFTAMHIWVSDQGSHFKIRVMELLATEHRINYPFTVAYSRWVNGTVENANRQIRAACTALLTDLKLAPQDWHTLIPLIASILDEAPLRRLGKRKAAECRTPLEVMTEIQPRRNTLTSGIPSTSVMRIDRIHAKKLVSIDKL